MEERRKSSQVKFSLGTSTTAPRTKSFVSSSEKSVKSSMSTSQKTARLGDREDSRSYDSQTRSMQPRRSNKSTDARSPGARFAWTSLKTDRDNNGVRVATLVHLLANAPSLAAAATTTDAVTTRVAMHLQAGTTPTTTTEATTTPATTTRTGVTVAVPTTSRNAQRAAAEGFAARREACNASGVSPAGSITATQSSPFADLREGETTPLKNLGRGVNPARVPVVLYPQGV